METLYVVIKPCSVVQKYFLDRNAALDYVVRYIINKDICTRSYIGYLIGIEVYKTDKANATNPLQLSHILVPQNMESFMKQHNMTKDQVLGQPLLCYDIFGAFDRDIYFS